VGFHYRSRYTSHLEESKMNTNAPKTTALLKAAPFSLEVAHDA
jgi:hypothetical protein